jgi:AcrR family transcriptional regulator
MPKGSSGRPMQQRARETRAAVLLAAARVFDELGYAGASIDQIAQEGGLTKGALYFHFESKADLALAVVNANYEVWVRLQAEIASRGLPPLDQVSAVVRDLAVCFGDDVVIRGGMRLNSDRKAIPVELPVPYSDWIDYFRPLLVRAQEQGTVRPELDVDMLSRVTVSGLFGVQLVSERLTDRADVVERVDEWWDAYMLPVMTGRLTNGN